VRHHQLAYLDVAGDESPAIIAFQVEWFLVAQVDARRCDQRKDCFFNSRERGV